MGPRGPQGPRWGPETLRALGAPRALEALRPSISYFYTILPPTSPAHETLHQLSNYNLVCLINLPKTLQQLIFYTILMHVVKSFLLEKTTDIVKWCHNAMTRGISHNPQKGGKGPKGPRWGPFHRKEKSRKINFKI